MKLQAREIIRAAKRTGTVLRRGATGSPYYGNRRCAVSTIGFAIYGDDDFANENVARHLGHPIEDIMALEHGFEGWTYREDLLKNRYYRVGKRVAQLAGLPPK